MRIRSVIESRWKSLCAIDRDRNSVLLRMNCSPGSISHDNSIAHRVGVRGLSRVDRGRYRRTFAHRGPILPERIHRRRSDLGTASRPGFHVHGSGRRIDGAARVQLLAARRVRMDVRSRLRCVAIVRVHARRTGSLRVAGLDPARREQQRLRSVDQHRVRGRRCTSVGPGDDHDDFPVLRLDTDHVDRSSQCARSSVSVLAARRLRLADGQRLCG